MNAAPRVLFLARGHGFGHAARDLRIVRAMRALRPDVAVDVMASGSAAVYLELYGETFADMGIGDHEDMSPAAGRRVWELLDQREPYDLVVADEVVWSLVYCAKRWRRRAILLTDWFYSELGAPESDPLLDEAGEILLLDFSAAHPGPFGVRTPIQALGPVVGEFGVDRAAARAALGVAAADTVAVLTVGGMTKMADNAAIAELTVRTWLAHAPAGHRLFVLAEPFCEVPAERAADVVWAGFTAEPETYYAGADLVVTNANGTVTCDLVWNRIPVLAMTHPAVSYPDSFGLRVKAMSAAGMTVHAEATVSTAELWRLMGEAMRNEPHPDPALEWTTGEQVARHLLGRLDFMLAKAGSAAA
ncbi:hypothetical protein ACFQY4_24800 [Catellatospora bangladeshensis]|uniref:Uncharacterized protein n=1 Tax=Catellatospora bangladeshensis TaxID=310355 RepID=A0A8J3JPC2_9ACTN|nr:hypothetical protein [Catellatospora bangladeshensis]GIF81469.1 hypothetical protein Cba03nite_28180 [Catellatospora bangladeshensis]